MGIGGTAVGVESAGATEAEAVSAAVVEAARAGLVAGEDAATLAMSDAFLSPDAEGPLPRSHPRARPRPRLRVSPDAPLVLDAVRGRLVTLAVVSLSMSSAGDEGAARFIAGVFLVGVTIFL